MSQNESTTFLVTDVNNLTLIDATRENSPWCGEGGALSLPATLHRLQNPKWPPGGPKMTDGVWKGVSCLSWWFWTPEL